MTIYNLSNNRNSNSIKIEIAYYEAEMAQQMIRNRLINFQTFSCGSEEQRNCHRQAYNSLMLKLSQLDAYEEIEQLTQCEKQECRMVLTNQDREYIDDWNWVQANEEHYGDIKDKIDKMRTNKWGYYIWNCRFCGHKNLLEKGKAHFAKNRVKVVIKDGVQGDKVAGTSESPLLLFLIDNSSSMEQQLNDLNEALKKKQPSTNKELKMMINEVLRKTNIYQKISDSQKKQLNEIKKKMDPDGKAEPYIDNLTKYKVLMSMTEKVVNQICDGKYNSPIRISVQPTSERKIGFMFFNSDVVLQKIPRKNETKVIRVSNREYEGDQSKENHLKADFQNFNELYHLGKKNSQDYGMNIANFKFSDIELGGVSATGQTALGPALAIATGIASGYGSGSLIVIVTDGKANKGIFSEEGIFEEEIKLLTLKLNKARCQTCLMKLEHKGGEQKGTQKQSTLQRYFRKNATILSISLFQKQPLKQLQKRLRQVLQKSLKSKTWTNNIRIKCQNPNIKYPEREVQKMKKKLFKQKQIEFISPEINEQKFTAFDYRHPFMTQILVEYQNIDTKEQAKFMAYITQKIIKYSEMSKKQQESVNSVETLQNVLQYLEVEGEKFDMDNIPLTLCQQSFRNSIMESYKHSIQREYQKEVMMDMGHFMDRQKPAFKNTKEYIKSLTESKYGEEAEEGKQEKTEDYLRL